ncbi:hypothetical protein JOH51_004557 [Rhizobium leguminosarum]|nr:hypothetical protein [Rhizobium leguminosarum]
MRRPFSWWTDRYHKHEKRDVILCVDGEFGCDTPALSVILGLEPRTHARC